MKNKEYDSGTVYNTARAREGRNHIWIETYLRRIKITENKTRLENCWEKYYLSFKKSLKEVSYLKAVGEKPYWYRYNNKHGYNWVVWDP